MANIYLIRHGQASWGKSDYDQLSGLGAEQSEVLGRYWQNMPTPELCYSGVLLRHRQTAENFLKGLKQTFPVSNLESFNEFDHADVLKCYRAEWQEQKAISQYLKQQVEPDKSFLIEFKNALTRWLSGDFDDYKESFIAFKQRCKKSLEEVMLAIQMQQQLAADGSTKNVIVFTSGGVISAICADIMQLNDRSMMKLNFQLVNSSVTKLVFNKDKVSVDSINNYSHLELVGSNYVTRI